MALSDSFARSQAAQSMIGGMGGAPEEMIPPEMAGEEMAAPPAPDLESSLAGVEAAIEGMEPTQAEEIRTHLNAIREVAAREGAEAPEEALAEEAAMDVGPDAGIPPGDEMPPEV